MKYLIVILIFMLGIQAQAKHLHPEKAYQAKWCAARQGITEYKLNDKTRVDCLLPDMAVEFDFANKWAECIGQALYYGQRTNRTPACVLIMENPEKDAKYLRRLRYTVYNKKKIPQFRTFTVKHDYLPQPIDLRNNKK